MNTRTEATDKPPPRDYRQEVTDNVIRLLEEGTAPWQKPWAVSSSLGTPINPTTNKPYRGGNVLNLMIQGMNRGYDDPRWCTYKQAADNDWQVRKGEKGTPIEFWDFKRGNESEDADDDEKRARMIHRMYSVFNGQQIDGIPLLAVEPRTPFEVIEAGEHILANSGADIRHGGSKAYYSRRTDHIQLPQKESFVDAPAYYATGCHEVIHWSGAEHRLNRETLTKSRGINAADEHYAREELIAEIGSMMLAAETGLPHDPVQHAAYVASWLDALRKDKNEIFRAASAASKATDYVLNLNRAVETPAIGGSHADHVASRRTTELSM